MQAEHGMGGASSRDPGHVIAMWPCLCIAVAGCARPLPSPATPQQPHPNCTGTPCTPSGIFCMRASQASRWRCSRSVCTALGNSHGRWTGHTKQSVTALHSSRTCLTGAGRWLSAVHKQASAGGRSQQAQRGTPAHQRRRLGLLPLWPVAVALAAGAAGQRADRGLHLGRQQPKHLLACRKRQHVCRTLETREQNMSEAGRWQGGKGREASVGSGCPSATRLPACLPAEPLACPATGDAATQPPAPQGVTPARPPASRRTRHPQSAHLRVRVAGKQRLPGPGGGASLHRGLPLWSHSVGHA